MRVTPRVLVPGAIAALVIAAAVVLGGQGERSIVPGILTSGSPSTSPTATPEPVVALVAIDCSSGAPAGPSSGSPAPALETCTGSVRIVGPSPIASLDAWVDSVDAAGTPFFACRARVGEDLAAGAVLTWKTVCELQPGTSTHRVHFSDRTGTPVRAAPPGQ